MPEGRTFEYRVFRVMERFGKTLDWFDNLSNMHQARYIAYCEIRDTEEHNFELARMKLSHGIK